MQPVKLRVFILINDNRQDRVVALPGDTPVVDVREAAHAALARRLGTVSFKITGVNLYPHWSKERDGNER